MTQDFFTWNLSTHRDLDAMAPLSDAECDDIFRLFDEAGLPPGAMNVDMADGYLTACAVGPNQPAVHDFLADIFGQTTLPICADPQKQEQLLILLLRRHRQIASAVRLRHPDITPDNVFLPLVSNVDAAKCISPYQTDANDDRLGNWKYKDWAGGFRRAVVADPHWMLLVENPETSHLVTPLVLFDVGYNPDYADLQIDNNQDLEAQLVTMPYRLHQFWRDFNHHRKDETLAAARDGDYTDTYQEPYQRDTAKIGRNDPCPCGSGKKYKKCCGI